jgi:hypothetical protein
MTVPQWFLLLAAICLAVRAWCGILNLIDNHNTGYPDTFPREWVTTNSRPYDQEIDAA